MLHISKVKRLILRLTTCIGESTDNIIIITAPTLASCIFTVENYKTPDFQALHFHIERLCMHFTQDRHTSKVCNVSIFSAATGLLCMCTATHTFIHITHSSLLVIIHVIQVLFLKHLSLSQDKYRIEPSKSQKSSFAVLFQALRRSLKLRLLINAYCLRK